MRGGGLAIELERLAGLGIHPLTRADADYPARYRQRLKKAAPAVLFYAGNKELLGQPGLAVVGSRNLDEAGQACAEFVGNACGFRAWSYIQVGHGRGFDQHESLPGKPRLAVGILADSLEKAIRVPEYRAA